MINAPNALAILSLFNALSLFEKSSRGQVRITSGKRINYLNVEIRLSFFALEPLTLHVTPGLSLSIGGLVLEDLPTQFL